MVIHIMAYKVVSVGISDIGLVRQNNEDVWAQMPEQNFFVLADGMGGHQAGEIAAKEAVNYLCNYVTQHIDISSDELSIDEVRNDLIEAIETVNAHVYKMGRRDQDLKGMGTTLCSLYFHPKGLVYAHVGDSRIYRLRNKKLMQLTKDHSLLRELLDLGQLSERQAEDFVYKNIITKAIGTEATVQPSVRFCDLMDQDVFMMCSDGLSDLLSKEEMEAILNKKNNLKQVAQNLVNAAKEKGGHDNITVVLVKIQEKHAKKDLSRQ